MRFLTAMLIASVAMLAVAAFYPSAVYAQTVAESSPVTHSGMMADRVVTADSAIPAVQVYRRGWRGGFYRGGYGGYYPYGRYYPYRSYRYYSWPYRTCYWNGWTTVCSRYGW